MSQHDHDYWRRRKIAEDKIAHEALMPEDSFVVGAVRLHLYEKLVREHMPPPADEPAVYQSAPLQPMPTSAQVASVMGKPTAIRDDLTRMREMDAGIAADMQAAERRRLGEPDEDAQQIRDDMDGNEAA